MTDTQAVALLILATIFAVFSVAMVRRGRADRMPERWQAKVILDLLERNS